jgi:hypothetical protein
MQGKAQLLMKWFFRGIMSHVMVPTTVVPSARLVFALSPNLNPIGHAWGILRRKLGSYESNPANLDDLWTRVQSGWKNITPDQCYNLIASMPKGTRAVNLAKGSYTNS